MFVLVFEGVLFVFAYVNPAFEPLFALPLNRTPKDRQPFMSNNLFILFILFIYES